MVHGKFKDIDIGLRCYSCKSEYSSSNCSGCIHFGLGLGNDDKYESIDNFEINKNDIVMSDTNRIHNLKLKPNTIEITIPEGVESIIINFEKKNRE